MVEAKQQGKAIQLLTNLAWVRKKLEVSGPADIINDYIKVYKLVEEEEVRVNYHKHNFHARSARFLFKACVIVSWQTLLLLSSFSQ